MQSDRHHLRTGFSTGACVSAVILAALRSYTTPQFHEELTQTLLFPDGQQRLLTLLEVHPGFASIIKDGGDDPDCTHGAEIYARLRPAQIDELGEHDYLVSNQHSCHVILRAVEGIGLCTRLGLDCERNHWAINIGPRQMLQANLPQVPGCFLAEIGVKQGEELAHKTLNPRLGIQGGISILGTTGLVRPFSNEAYIATIRICLRSINLSGGTQAVLCTGGRTQKTAQSILQHLPETAFICIGDFIQDSIQAAQQQHINHIILSCMPGKLCKYAAGFQNTHAHKVDQAMHLFSEVYHSLLDHTRSAQPEISSHSSIRQALEYVEPQLIIPLYRAFCKLAYEHFSTWAPSITVRFLICDFDGTLLLDIIHSSDPHQPCHP